MNECRIAALELVSLACEADGLTWQFEQNLERTITTRARKLGALRELEISQLIVSFRSINLVVVISAQFAPSRLRFGEPFE